MTIAYRNEEMLRMVDPETGTVDRRIFAEKDIYELELERIFARAWNFMCHDSQIPNPGDFFMTFIGEDRVICVRDNDGNPQVLVNTCRHRGNAVCRAEEGHATSFMCTYHGWTYDLRGSLVGVPGFKEVYHEELDRENWGLIKAAQAASFKGFIFATMDAEAPDLETFLGEVGRLSIAMIAERGSVQAIGGVQKYTIGCNWKLAVDNVWDYYHPMLTHASSLMAGYGARRAARTGAPAQPRPTAEARRQNMGDPVSHRVILGDYGHALSGPSLNSEAQRAGRESMGMDLSWRERPEKRSILGEAGLPATGHPNIFPNMWIGNMWQVSMRLPKGPHTTEIWWFTFRDTEAEGEAQEEARYRAIHTFGPAGMLEQEDGENWGESTKATTGLAGSQFPLHYAMNLGRGEIIEPESGPAYIDTHINEHAQLWLYRAWSEWMASESWVQLEEKRSRPPQGQI